MSAHAGPVTKTSGLYRIHIFKQDGSFTPDFTGNVEVMVVGGGGGGGANMGGGGGAGGYLANTSYAVVADTIMPVTVGVGGYGAPAGLGSHPLVPGLNGTDSVFGTLTSVGGGRGGTSYNTANVSDTHGLIHLGAPGGSGGGVTGYNNDNLALGTKAGGLGTVGQGNDGGDQGTRYYCGGGGGAGAVGVSGNSQPNGGIGISNSILGSPFYWAGGGGGASYTLGTGGNGGNGGGGGGARGTTTGGDGYRPGYPGGGGAAGRANRPGGSAGRNTGGGGGGGSHYHWANKGGDGGDGIVIIKYLVSTGSAHAPGAATYSSDPGSVDIDAGNEKSYPGTGTVVTDLSLNGSNGTLVGGTGFNSANGGSFVFDGTNDYIDLSSDILISAANRGWTAEFWFNTSSVGTLQNFVSAVDDTYNADYLCIYNSKLALWNKSPAIWKYGDTVLLSNTWYQAVFVCDAGGTSMRFYVNGEPEGGDHLAYSWAATYSALYCRYIGTFSYSAALSRYFIGNIAKTRLYNKALSAERIKKNFRALRSRFGI